MNTTNATSELTYSMSADEAHDLEMGLIMTREINNNPEEVEALERSIEQFARGEGRRLSEDETGDEEEGGE